MLIFHKAAYWLCNSILIFLFLHINQFFGLIFHQVSRNTLRRQLFTARCAADGNVGDVPEDHAELSYGDNEATNQHMERNSHSSRDNSESGNEADLPVNFSDCNEDISSSDTDSSGESGASDDEMEAIPPSPSVHSKTSSNNESDSDDNDNASCQCWEC